MTNRVARRLDFGVEDEVPRNEDNSINQMMEALRECAEEKAKKWNFDFANERPLEGDWEWIPVQQEEEQKVNPQTAVIPS